MLVTDNMDCGCYEPTKYDINRCGLPVYHVQPNLCCQGQSYNMNCYNGFGVNPEWRRVYYRECSGNKCCNKNSGYQAKVQPSSAPDMVIVYFPADDQKYLGNYKLIVKAEVYESGYENNIRTITIDYPNVFELVESSEQADMDGTDIVLTVGTNFNQNIDHICVNPSSNTKVISGNLGFIIANVCPNKYNQDILWSVDSNYIDVINGKGNVLTFKARRIPATSNKYITTIVARAKDNPSVFVEIPVTIYNYATAIVIGMLKDYQHVNFTDSVKIIPQVKMSDDSLVTMYRNTDGELFNCVRAKITSGSFYASILENEDGSFTITNSNRSDSNQNVTVEFTSTIAGIDDSLLVKTITFDFRNLAGSELVNSDIYTANSAYDYGTHSIISTLTNGTTIKSSLGDEFEFYKK